MMRATVRKHALASHPLAWKNFRSCPSPSTITCRSIRPGPISAARRSPRSPERHGATVNVKPCKFGPIFEQTGGLPLPKRSPQRRAYRMMELKRWREVRDAPIHLEPKHFPCDDAAAVRLVIAARLQGKDAHRLSLELGRALWEREETLADPATMAAAAQARRSRRRGAARRRSFGRRTRRAVREIYPGSAGCGRLRCAELRAAFGRDILGPGPAGPAGTRVENAGGLIVEKHGSPKKQGATGITTVAPYIAGQWGRGNNRLPGRLRTPRKRSMMPQIFFVHG